MPDFKGFSSSDGMKVLYDFQLVRQGLINHFNTVLGSLDHNPEYGSILPLMIFELKNGVSRAVIESDIKRVIGSEPRVEYLSHSVSEQEHGFTIDVQLRYMKLNPIETLTIDFDKRNFGGE